jgi:itaconate CoA-transferase
MRALEGTLVVSLEQAVAAPFASAKLAEAGARVIKIERAAGDFARGYDHVVQGESAYFVWLNQGKESLVLDIKDPADAVLLRRMIARADVFIQNLAPGAAARAGFGAEALRRDHPRLVTCDISGYGETGPYASMKAYDNLLQGEAGVIAVTGYPDAPAKVGISICDIGAGVHAYAAILEALLARERSGEGRAIQVSLFDCMADWMTVPYLHQVYGGAAPPRSGLHHASIAPYGPYAARDGRRIILAIQNEREWARFCATVLGRPEVAEAEPFRGNSARVANREELDRVIAEALRDLSLEELVERLRAADVAFGRMNSVAELAAHPQLRLVDVETPGGTARLPASPVRLAGERAPRAGRVPGLGQHSERLRREFAGEGRP